MTQVRDATLNDAESILKIYDYYVKNTAITFEYDTPTLAKFHAHLGFETVGTFHNCGYKFGRWYDMIWMKKIIGEHNDNQPPIRRYLEIHLK